MAPTILDLNSFVFVQGCIMLVKPWCSNLQDHYERCKSRLQDSTTPNPAEVRSYEQELLDIVESQVSSHANGNVPKEFLDLVFQTWLIIVKLIRRRIFQDDFSGATLMRISEFDYGYADALFSLSIGALLPSIDFDVNVALGYFSSTGFTYF